MDNKKEYSITYQEAELIHKLCTFLISQINVVGGRSSDKTFLLSKIGNLSNKMYNILYNTDEGEDKDE